MAEPDVKVVVVNSQGQQTESTAQPLEKKRISELGLTPAAIDAAIRAAQKKR